MFNIFALNGGIGEVDGFFCGGVKAGLKKDDYDLAFVRSENLYDVSYSLTTNFFQAAPLKHLQNYGKNFKSDFILINSKNANAMTGEVGIKDIDEIFKNLKIETTNPIMSSTGVIGYRLPIEKIITAFEKFDFNAKNSDLASRAIMTTDRFKKEILYKVELENGESFKVGAMAKGAGMINPSMATMLCFIATDADIPKDDMDEILQEVVEESFNAISVDGDTSTNDTVLLLANKKSKIYDKDAFREVLKIILKHLALEILRDGEGTNKVVAFEITGAKSKADAIKVAKKLSNSLLVKTALFGEDPNWGRIASTVGSSGVKCCEESLVIKYDDVLIYSKVQKELDKQTEEKAYKVMKKDSFKISCDLGMGEENYTAYGCDLSYEYVKINAEYRT